MPGMLYCSQEHTGTRHFIRGVVALKKSMPGMLVCQYAPITMNKYYEYNTHCKILIYLHQYTKHKLYLNLKHLVA